MPTTPLRARAIACFSFTVLLAACSSGGDPVQRLAPVARVALERSADTVWLGRTRTIRAVLTSSDGTALTDRAVTWRSSDTTLLMIAPTADGGVLMRGLGVGATRLIARAEGIESSIPISVTLVPAGRLELAAPDTVLLGRATTVQARAWAPDGTELTSADLAGRSVAWSSDRSAQLTVAGLADAVANSASGLSAVVRAVTAGNATVSASLDGKQARYTIIAARAPVVGLTLPAFVTLTVGGTTTVSASPYDWQGLPVSGAPIVYALSTGTGVVSLASTTEADGSPAVRVSALAPGSATIAASVDGRTSSVSVTVTASGAALRVYPTSVVAAPGARGRFSATIVDAAGEVQAAGTVIYRTSNAAVASIDHLGQLTLGAAGSATVTVTSGGYTVTVPVTVAPPPASRFHIDVRPVGNVPAAVLLAAQRAALRWERVIVSEVRLAQIDLGPSDCDLRTPAMHESIQSLVVFLKTEWIDGARGTVAYAGPCVMHDVSAGGLPLVGAMTVDSADVSLLTGSSGALAEDVLTHELGHVLGIGTLWTGGIPAGNLTKQIAGDPRFIGAGATAATARIGLATIGIDGAPVEDMGGAGTAGGHWRERIFAGELMTGWINPSPNPLSIVTVLSLRDLGYDVTETGADIVSPLTIAGGTAFSGILSSTARGPQLDRGIGTPTAPLPLGERLLRPTFVAGPDGTRKRQ